MCRLGNGGAVVVCLRGAVSPGPCTQALSHVHCVMKPRCGEMVSPGSLSSRACPHTHRPGRASMLLPTQMLSIDLNA